MPISMPRGGISVGLGEAGKDVRRLWLSSGEAHELADLGADNLLHLLVARQAKAVMP